jgi:GT2 family glycosyltransferase
MTAEPTCSIVVPATNRPPTLARCLAAISRGIRPQDEVVVVDDLPTRSPARIRNEGALRAAGEIVVFVDADVIAHEDAIELLRAAFAADPDLTAAFGSYDDDPPPGLVSQFRNLLHHHMHQESPGEVETFWAGLSAVRRDAFVAAGGFDTRRPMLEDVEFGLRLIDAGQRIVLVPTVQGTHLKRWTLRTMLYTDLHDRGIPWTRLLIERRSVPTTLNLGWRHRLSAATVLATPIVALRARRPVAVVIGAGCLVALNGRFYGLLARRGGPRLAVVGLGLHALHHAAAIAALPLGALEHLRHGGPRAGPPPLEPIRVGDSG